MILETTRLRIVPLTVEQFRLLLCGTKEMEKELRLNPCGEDLDENTQQAMQYLYEKAEHNQGKYLWYTNWQIILKEENLSIGSACFINEPDKEGKVEIGYGINKDYRNCGYMAETVNSMCRWALGQDGVKKVIAETGKDNYASHKVLQKCGFKKYNETESGFFWEVSEVKNILVEN